MLALALMATTAVVAVAGSAAADEAKSVQVVGQEARRVDLLVYLDPLAQATAESTVTSSVVISGVEVPSEPTIVVSKSAPTAPRRVILVLDESGSMKGDRIAAARQAAASYVQALPADVEVGVISFNDTVDFDVEPTADRAAVLAAIESVAAGKKTALYDGLVEGLDRAGGDAGARVLLLSDGGDTASKTSLDATLARVATSGTPVDVVALTPNLSHADVLRGIAASSGGQYLLANDAAGLLKAFDEATGSFGGKVAVATTIPANVDGSGKFAVVSVTVDGTAYTGTTEFPHTQDLVNTEPLANPVPVVAPVNAPAVPVAEASSTMPWLYGLLAALIVAILVLAFAYYGQTQRSVRRTERVLRYADVTTGLGTRALPPVDLQQRSLVKGLDEVLSGRPGYSIMEAKLDNGEVHLTPGSWLIVRVLIGLVLVFVFSTLFGNVLGGLVVGVPAAWLGTRAYLNSREAERRKAFEAELPDFLLLIASALRSGLSFTQALDSTAAEGKGQVSRQIRRALSESQTGVPVEQTLMRAAERMDSDDLRWAVTALAIQREVGGNLSSILDTAAATVQGRAELRREVRTLSAEGRLSGLVLAALPVGVFAYLFVTNRDYVSFFWTQTVGQALLLVTGIAFVVGFIWMGRVVRIKV